MSTTIFCTFDQQDLADLAMGELRNTTVGVKSIHYVNGFNSRTNGLNKGNANDSWMGLFPLQDTTSSVMPSRPANVKIVCSDAAAKTVKSKLVNLRAYEIVTMR